VIFSFVQIWTIHALDFGFLERLKCTRKRLKFDFWFLTDLKAHSYCSIDYEERFLSPI
jgi:hypothetical protein